MKRSVRAGMFGAAMVGLVVAAGTVGGSKHAGASVRVRTISPQTMKLLKARVESAESVPSFKTPGPAVNGAQALRGKKVMIIPGVPLLATCQQIATAASQLSRAAGMKPTIFQGSGTPQSWTSGIEYAIHEGYAAVMLECGVNTGEIAPALATAHAHGVDVTVYGVTPSEVKGVVLAAADADPYVQDQRISVDEALVMNDGKPFDALVVQSADSPSNGVQMSGLKSEMKLRCPACQITLADVSVPAWSTEFASTVTSELLSHPNVTAVWALYAGELPYMRSGIEAAHRANDIKSFGAFGGGSAELQIQAQAPGNHVVMGDIYGDPTWIGYELVYQTALVLRHQRPTPLDGYYVPNRLVTPSNVKSVIETGGFGSAFVNGYRKLFGLSPLTGQALLAAALAK
jgi:ABC-type sugar transport system substrate-binding protein